MFNYKSVALVAITLLGGAAQAAFIVDTGPGQSPSTGAPSLFSAGISYQNFGATFAVTDAWTINSVEGWIGAGTGQVVFELYGGPTPNDALLHSIAVTINDPANAWRGATGLDWAITPGDYTLTVIAQPGFSGWMVTSPPNPLGSEWVQNPFSPSWAPSNFDLGWRVAASPVPVPAAGWLLLPALGALGLARRR